MDLDTLFKNITVENIDLYLANGGDINAKPELDFSILWKIYFDNYPKELFLYIIEKGFDERTLGIALIEGTTHLPKDDTEAIEILLNKGADVLARDDDGDTALHYSVFGNLLGVTSLLLHRGADINAQNNDGDTPLHYALRNNDKKMTILLIDSGASLDIKNNNGTTCIDAIKKNGWNFLLSDRRKYIFYTY